MRVSELGKKSNNELQKLLRQNREKLRKLRFDLVSGKLKDHRVIRKTKKEIARILTLLRNYESLRIYESKKE